jgi:hypothetical protein
MIKYGVQHTGQLESVKTKFKQTCLTKYGVENPSQNAEIAEKASSNGYKIKKYELPSGKIIKCQGYEPFALRDLVSLKINEDDIVNEKTKVYEGAIRELITNGIDPFSNEIIELQSEIRKLNEVPINIEPLQRFGQTAKSIAEDMKLAEYDVVPLKKDDKN